MKSRGLKLLFILVLDTIKKETEKKYSYNSGICRVIYQLLIDNLITLDEYWNLKLHLMLCKPTNRNKFKSFYLEEIFNKDDNLFWWKRMSTDKKFIDVRIRFLEAVIKSLK